MYPKIKGNYPDLIYYFSEYNENSKYLPSKKYMWHILSAWEFAKANTFISYSLKERNQEENEDERIVEIYEDVPSQLHAAHYFCKRKEREYLCLQHQRS